MACEDSASLVAVFPADCPHLSHFHRSCGSAGSTEFPANSQIDLGLVAESPLNRHFNERSWEIDSSFSKLSHDVLNPARVPL